MSPSRKGQKTGDVGQVSRSRYLTTRICRVCGEEKDLDKFAKSKKGLFGRSTCCKGCENQHRRERGLHLIEGFGRPIRCHFCGEEVTVLEGWGDESLVIHSLDGHHENWDPANKVPAHRKCHGEHHFPMGEGNPNWKEEAAKEETKLEARKYYQKRKIHRDVCNRL